MGFKWKLENIIGKELKSLLKIQIQKYIELSKNGFIYIKRKEFIKGLVLVRNVTQKKLVKFINEDYN